MSLELANWYILWVFLLDATTWAASNAFLLHLFPTTFVFHLHQPNNMLSTLTTLLPMIFSRSCIPLLCTSSTTDTFYLPFISLLHRTPHMIHILFYHRRFHHHRHRRWYCTIVRVATHFWETPTKKDETPPPTHSGWLAEGAVGCDPLNIGWFVVGDRWKWFVHSHSCCSCRFHQLHHNITSTLDNVSICSSHSST